MRMLPLLLALVVSACSPAARLRMESQRDTRTLAAAADEYWTAIRWNDIATASRFLANPAEQLKLGRAVSDPRVRLTEADVLQVVLGEPLGKERLPATRDGVAIVRIDGYDLVSGRAEVFTLEQHWIRNDHRWTIDAERSPLSNDRPWTVTPR